MKDTSEDLAIEISKILDSKKAIDIVVLDLDNLSSIADYFIIATGTSSKHASALADEIEKNINKKGVFIGHKEGQNDGRWILMDYLDVVVHIFTKDERSFYDLERIWKDAKYVELDIDSL